MSTVRRVTITVSADSIDILQAEAKRRRVSLTSIVTEIIEEKVSALRLTPRPRLGLGASAGRSAGAAALTGQPVADRPR